jgi:sugar (pentulose or hexulose) kinase
LAVREHEQAGQKVTRVTVSGGIARSDLMCEILASVLDRPLLRLVSEEGPALGAAAIALAGLENYLRRSRDIATPFTVADAVTQMIRFRAPAVPNPMWQDTYRRGMREFQRRLRTPG